MSHWRPSDLEPLPSRQGSCGSRMGSALVLSIWLRSSATTAAGRVFRIAAASSPFISSKIKEAWAGLNPLNAAAALVGYKGVKTPAACCGLSLGSLSGPTDAGALIALFPASGLQGLQTTSTYGGISFNIVAASGFRYQQSAFLDQRPLLQWKAAWPEELA